MILMKKILSVLLILNILCMPVFAEYDFSDEAQAEFDRQKEIQLQPVDFSKKKNGKEIKNNKIQETQERTQYNPSPLLYENNLPHQKPLYGSVVKVPSGTNFSITFDSGISSGSLEKDDRLTVRLTNDLVYNGNLIAPSGSLVYGTATDAQNAGYAYGSGEIELCFNEILTPDGNLINISTEKIYLAAKKERAAKMTRDVVLGALGSMLIGAAFTALGGGDDWGRNMAIYGGLGAIGGGIRGVSQRGEEVQIPDGTTLNVKLNKPLTASPYRILPY